MVTHLRMTPPPPTPYPLALLLPFPTILNLINSGRSLESQGVKPVANALWTLPNIHPPLIVRGDILHNVYLGILKHVMQWMEEFLKKHKRLHIFDNIWESIPPYSGYNPPSKKYRQITMWSGNEMRGFLRVILACFTAALHQGADASSLPSTAQRDVRMAIRCVRNITDFCLMTQYRSHTPQTIEYMMQYLRGFHESNHIFREFRATKADHQEARVASQQLAITHSNQANLEDYFQLTPTQRAARQREDRDERRQLVHDILNEGHFNFPKLHLLSHYGLQITQFGSLVQYSTDITEALHKPLKDAYRRSNRVDAVEQILDTITREHAVRILELNLQAWDKESDIGLELKQLFQQPSPATDQHSADSSETNRVLLSGKQDIGYPNGTPLEEIARKLSIPELVTKFTDYLRLNRSPLHPPPDSEEIPYYRTYHYNTLSIPISKFQGDGLDIQKIRWTGERGFRQRGDARADWVWIRRQVRSMNERQNGELDGRTIGKLEGLFRVQNRTLGVYEIAYVRLLKLRGSRKPHGEEGMIRMEAPQGKPNTHVIRVTDIEGMAHVIELEKDKLWLVNNRIDLNTWNELYD